MTYFVTNDAINGYELWKSDGTAVGTEAITSISDTSEIFIYQSFSGGLLYLEYDTSSFFGSIYLYDGSSSTNLTP